MYDFIRKYKLVIFSALFFLLSFECHSQAYFEELAGTSDTSEVPGLVTEQIRRISDNKNIFVITNSSNTFTKGDFVSLIMNNKLTARALVAKDADSLSGIKILKIYSLNNWNQIKEGLEIQVLKGDDSYFLNMLNKKSSSNEEQKETAALIEDENDLFNSTMLEDDVDFDDNKKRAIKTDNLVFAYYGMIAGKNTDKSNANFSIWVGSWAYQFSDNIWGEASLGRTLVADYPDGGLDTTLTLVSFKLKYTFKGPFYSYIQPYVGYQTVTADSPGAGVNVGEEQKQKELELVEEIEQNTPIFGVSVIKRLVPGWFVRADVGNDLMSLGFGLEF